MPTSIPDLITRARLEMGDGCRPFQNEYQGDGTTTVIMTQFSPVDPTSITVVEGGTPLVLNSDYTLDDESGTITLTVPIPNATVLQVMGKAYRYFSDDDWTTFFTSALDQHILNRVDEVGQPVTLDNLPDVETYPVVLLGLTQALAALLNDASFDIDISTPEGVSIPRSQRVDQLWHMYSGRLDQYNKMCAALNVGMYRIETLKLRRISRVTERLVPLYQAQEFQDNRWPRQLFPPLNTDALPPELVVEYDQRIDLVGFANQDFVTTVTLGSSVAGYQVAAGIRRYPAALTPMIFMTTDILDVDTGQIQITVNGRLMYYCGLSKFWDLQLVDAEGNVTTPIGGTFDAIQQGNPGLGYYAGPTS